MKSRYIITLILSLFLLAQLSAQDTAVAEHEDLEKMFQEFEKALLADKLIGQTEDTLFKVFSKNIYSDSSYVIRYNNDGKRGEWWIDSIVFDGWLWGVIDTILLKSVQIDGKGWPEIVLTFGGSWYQDNEKSWFGRAITMNKIINLDSKKELFVAIESQFSFDIDRPGEYQTGPYESSYDTTSYRYDFNIDSTGLITIKNLKIHCVSEIRLGDEIWKTDGQCNKQVDKKEGVYEFIDGEYRWSPFVKFFFTYKKLKKRFYKGSDGNLYIKTRGLISPPENEGPEFYKKVPDIDVASYEQFSYYATDKNHVYIDDGTTDGRFIKRLEKIDVTTFQVVWYRWGKDKNHVFYNGRIKEGIQANDPMLEFMKKNKREYPEIHRIYDEHFITLNETKFKVGDIYRIHQRIFKYDQPILEKVGFERLDSVAAFMKRNPTIVMEVRTHLSGGSDNYSRNLSKKRAIAVVNFLVLKGIERKRMLPKGYGYIQPITDEKMIKMLEPKYQQKAHEMNRRTEFVITNIDFNADEK